MTGERTAYSNDGRAACEWNVAVHDVLSVCCYLAMLLECPDICATYQCLVFFETHSTGTLIGSKDSLLIVSDLTTFIHVDKEIKECGSNLHVCTVHN